jgi:hypothetical protein
VKRRSNAWPPTSKSFPPPDTALRTRAGGGAVGKHTLPLARALTPTLLKGLPHELRDRPRRSRPPPGAVVSRAMAGGPTSTATPCATRCAWARSSPTPASSPRWKAASDCRGELAFWRAARRSRAAPVWPGGADPHDQRPVARRGPLHPRVRCAAAAELPKPTAT